MAVNVKLEHNTDKKLPSLPSSSVPSKIKPTMGPNAPMKTEKTDYEEERENDRGQHFGYDVRQTLIENIETISQKSL